MLLAAALLSALSSGDINVAALKNILDSGCIKYNAKKGKKVIGELARKDLESFITEGSKNLATMSSGGGGAATAPATAAATGTAPAIINKEEKKEEP